MIHVPEVHEQRLGERWHVVRDGVVRGHRHREGAEHQTDGQQHQRRFLGRL